MLQLWYLLNQLFQADFQFYTSFFFLTDVEDPAGLHFPDDRVVWPRHQRKDHYGSNGT